MIRKIKIDAITAARVACGLERPGCRSCKYYRQSYHRDDLYGFSSCHAPGWLNDGNRRLDNPCAYNFVLWEPNLG